MKNLLPALSWMCLLPPDSQYHVRNLPRLQEPISACNHPGGPSILVTSGDTRGSWPDFSPFEGVVVVNPDRKSVV